MCTISRRRWDWCKNAERIAAKICKLHPIFDGFWGRAEISLGWLGASHRRYPSESDQRDMHSGFAYVGQFNSSAQACHTEIFEFSSVPTILEIVAIFSINSPFLYFWWSALSVSFMNMELRAPLW